MRPTLRLALRAAVLLLVAAPAAPAVALADTTTPDFSLSASPSSLSTGGQSASTSIRVAPSNGFAEAVTFSVGPVPTGLSASFNPTTSTTGTTLTFTPTVSCPSSGTVTVTGTAASGLTRTVQVSVVAPVCDFGIGVNPSSLSVAQGGTGLVTVLTAPQTGFSGGVTFSVTGLPTGVTAAFNPTSVPAGQSTTLTLTVAADAPATAGSVPVTVTGMAGSIAARATVALTVTATTGPSFTLSASPSSLTVPVGASATSAITVVPSGGFSGTVTFSISSSGVPASVSPTASTTGTTLTVRVPDLPGPIPSDPVPVTVTGTSGGLTRTVTVLVRETANGGGTGGVTATPVVASNSAFFNELDLRLANTGALSSMSLTITVQRTTGVAFSGQYNTVGGQIVQTNSSTASAITYTFTLASGQTLAPGANWTFAAQASGTGTAHPTSGDTFTVSYTTGGASFTQTGHF